MSGLNQISEDFLQQWEVTPPEHHNFYCLHSSVKKDFIICPWNGLGTAWPEEAPAFLGRQNSSGATGYTIRWLRHNLQSLQSHQNRAKMEEGGRVHPLTLHHAPQHLPGSRRQGGALWGPPLSLYQACLIKNSKATNQICFVSHCWKNSVCQKISKGALQMLSGSWPCLCMLVLRLHLNPLSAPKHF